MAIDRCIPQVLKVSQPHFYKVHRSRRQSIQIIHFLFYFEYIAYIEM